MLLIQINCFFYSSQVAIASNADSYNYAIIQIQSNKYLQKIDCQLVLVLAKTPFSSATVAAAATRFPMSVWSMIMQIYIHVIYIYITRYIHLILLFGFIRISYGFANVAPFLLNNTICTRPFDQLMYSSI